VKELCRQFLAWCLCELNDLNVYVEGQRGLVPASCPPFVVDLSEMTNLVVLGCMQSDDAMLQRVP
jgi:hypothetical protein